MNKKITIISLILLIVLLFITGCDMKLRKLKKQEFNLLKQNVVQLLGSDYKVQKINISEEGYTNEEQSEYLVEFSFDLNKPILLMTGTGIPGRFVFQKDESGEWKCILNTGNPSELFNFLR
jgi:type III secretory pathway lipoprotein EscJ